MFAFITYTNVRLYKPNCPSKGILENSLYNAHAVSLAIANTVSNTEVIKLIYTKFNINRYIQTYIHQKQPKEYLTVPNQMLHAILAIANSHKLRLFTIIRKPLKNFNT